MGNRGLFDTNEDIHTLVNQLLGVELLAAPQLFQTVEESLIYLRIKVLPDGCKRLKVERPCIRRNNVFLKTP